MLHFLRTKVYAAPMYLWMGPSETKDSSLSSENIHQMDGSHPVTPQLAWWLLKVKSNVRHKIYRYLKKGAGLASLSLLLILPSCSYSRISTLPRAHHTVAYLSCPSCMLFPPSRMSLHHFCTWCTSALNVAQRSPPPGSLPDSLPTPSTSSQHPTALLLCVGAVCLQA